MVLEGETFLGFGVADEVRTALGNYTLPPGVENLTYTGAGNPTLRGNGLDNVITGGVGNDFLDASFGGSDTLIGGAGDDAFLFRAAFTPSDIVQAGAGGNDQMGLQGNYTGARAAVLSGVTGVEALILLSGTDTRFGDTANNRYSYTVVAENINVAAGETLIVDANDLRAGENVTFDGSRETDGSFFVYAGMGIDSYTGGAQNDVFLFRSSGFTRLDSIDGGGGTLDQIGLRGDYTGGNAVIFDATTMTNVEGLVLISGADTRFGRDTGARYSYDLTIATNANIAANTVFTVDGGTLQADERLLFNGQGELDASFRLFGGLGDDALYGGGGSDLIRGNLGADLMGGEGGADIFQYRSAAESTAASRDTIFSFVTGSDKIDLSRIDANTGVEGDQAFTFIGEGAFTAAGQLRLVYVQDFNGLRVNIEGDIDGDGVADLVIQVLPDQPLTGSDFFL